MGASRLRGNLLYIICLCAGFAVYGGPRGPDAPQTWWQVAGALLIMLGFGFSAYAAGWLASRKLFRREPGCVLALGLGLGLLSAWAQIVGLLGGLGYFPNPWLTPVLALPLLASLAKDWNPRFKLPDISWPRLLLALTFFLLLLVACIPDPMPDPLWYHLTGARWWMDAGRIYFAREHVALFWSGSWDALYLWPMHLLGGAAGGGLIAVQIAAQWLHLLCGGLLTALALHRYFGRIFPLLKPDWRWLVVLVAVLSASQQATIFLAKNDWGASLWLLCALLALPEQIFLAGLFLGFAFSAKLSVAFIGVPLLCYTVGRRWRVWPKLVPGILLGGLPYAARNFYFTGNPFFPVLSRWLHRPELAEAWRRAQDYDGGAFFTLTHKEFLSKLILADSPFLVFTAIAALTYRFWPERFRSAGRFCAVVAAATFLFYGKVGPLAEFRLFGLGCLLAAGAGLAFFLSLAETIPACAEKSVARRALTTGIFLAAALFTSYPWKAPLEFWRAPTPPEIIRQHFGGTAQAWVRLNVPPGVGVAGANEVRLYYLSEYRAYRIWDNYDLDLQLRHSRSLAEAVAKMQDAGIRYLLFTRLDWDRYFRKDILDALEIAWASHRETIAFETSNSKVIDLQKLADALRENPVPLANRDW